ncbi:AlpA family phage regulatory protein [Ottowia sp.]|mgnify:CR=1 FL=1|nr:AlpA family phage regulatory protein [Ottowia sp.]
MEIAKEAAVHVEPLQPGVFVRLKRVEAFAGLRRSSIYEQADVGLFPKPVKIGPRASAWLSDELLAWKAARVAERDVEAGKANVGAGVSA